MAGGPSTPALTAAVIKAGGFGFIAAGYLTVDELRQVTATTRTLTDGPFGINLFVPSAPGDAGEVARYGSTLQPEADRLGVASVILAGTTMALTPSWTSSRQPVWPWSASPSAVPPRRWSTGCTGPIARWR